MKGLLQITKHTTSFLLNNFNGLLVLEAYCIICNYCFFPTTQSSDSIWWCQQHEHMGSFSTSYFYEEVITYRGHSTFFYAFVDNDPFFSIFILRSTFHSHSFDDIVSGTHYHGVCIKNILHNEMEVKMFGSCLQYCFNTMKRQPILLFFSYLKSSLNSIIGLNSTYR